jgi:hypothetical protein
MVVLAGEVVPSPSPSGRVMRGHTGTDSRDNQLGQGRFTAPAGVPRTLPVRGREPLPCRPQPNIFADGPPLVGAKARSGSPLASAVPAMSVFCTEKSDGQYGTALGTDT